MCMADPGKNLRDYMSDRPKSRRTEAEKPKDRTPEAENPGGKPLRAYDRTEYQYSPPILTIPTIKQLRIQKCHPFPFFEKQLISVGQKKKVPMKKKYQNSRKWNSFTKKMISRKNLWARRNRAREKQSANWRWDEYTFNEQICSTRCMRLGLLDAWSCLKSHVQDIQGL